MASTANQAPTINTPTTWGRVKEKTGKMIGELQERVRKGMIMIVGQGPVPSHVAFIMDGNRRFARRSHVATIQGHSAGFNALEKILDWSMTMGVKEVSVYAFSIENFKRPKEEVDSLMALAAEKFDQMMQENKMIDKLGIKVRIMGDLDMIPEPTRSSIDRVVNYSKHNTKAILNVCFAYTARDEMAKSILSLSHSASRARASLLSSSSSSSSSFSVLEEEEERIVKLVRGGEDAITTPPFNNNNEDEKEEKKEKNTRRRRWREEVGEKEEEEEGERGGEWGWEDEVWERMMIKSAPDLLIRTSGEVRLSDFMLWQAAFSIVVFLNVLWPDFSVWHFLYTILAYQYNYSTMKTRREYYADHLKNKITSKDDHNNIDDPCIDSFEDDANSS